MSSKERLAVNPFRSLPDYEEFVYTIRQTFAIIERSTLVVIRRGKRTAILRGELSFAHGYRITVQERLSFDDGPVTIEFYGYELWRNTDKMAWYDAQPHPDDPNLASSHPHHEHIPLAIQSRFLAR